MLVPKAPQYSPLQSLATLCRGVQTEYLRNVELLQGKTYTREFPVNYPRGTARMPLLLPCRGPCFLLVS